MQILFIKTLALLTLGTLLSALGLFLWMLYAPIHILDVSAIDTVSTTIHPGGVFYYRVHYCKFSDTPATVFRTFHRLDESAIETFPSVATITLKGCKAPVVPLQTFPDLATGTWYMQSDVVFQVNGLRQEHVLFKSPPFEVTTTTALTVK